jgi:hypothetical protein
MQPSYVTEEHRDYKQRRATGQQFQASSKPRVIGQAGARGEFRTEGPRQLTQDDDAHAQKIESRPRPQKDANSGKADHQSHRRRTGQFSRNKM